MPTEAITKTHPAQPHSPVGRRRRGPLSLVLWLFLGNGLTCFGVGLLVGHSL